MQLHIPVEAVHTDLLNETRFHGIYSGNHVQDTGFRDRRVRNLCTVRKISLKRDRFQAQSRTLVQTEHQVQVLHGLAGGSFQ